MKKTFEFLLASGVIMSIAGAALGTYGIRHMVIFWEKSSGSDDLGVGQFARGLIRPHIFSFIGVGLAAYGIILVVRAFIFKDRMQDNQT